MSTLTSNIELAATVDSSHASRRFHLCMAIACSAILITSTIGCWLTSIHVVNLGMRVLAVLAVLAVVFPLPAYWHEKQRIALRESALTIPWAVLLAAILPFPLLVAARLHIPLRDAFFARSDQALGVHVPAIMNWASSHWFGSVLNASYFMLLPLLLAAAFAPAVAGKLRHAREFLVANLIAFAMGVPAFAFLPAIGPWYVYHFLATPAQQFCQDQLQALRLPGSYSYLSQGAGIVCFPSFHVIWAILCVAALWEFRPLRIPLALLSGMIIVSTMTTGWHYFTDVLAGMILAVVSLALAKFLTRRGASAIELADPVQAASIRSRDAIDLSATGSGQA